jgi:hypothetical protein
LGERRLVEMERGSAEQVVAMAGGKKKKPTLPGWDVLRVLGGEIAEVFAFAAGEEVDPHEPLLLLGRFEKGGLFQAAYLSGLSEAYWRLSVLGSYGRTDLAFPQGWPGPARLTWRDEAGTPREEMWPTWNPWPALVEVFEVALGQGSGEEGKKNGAWEKRGERITTAPGARSSSQLYRGPVPPPHRSPLPVSPALTWQDAVRQLELDDAARRSVEKRRASALEYQEASEEAGFKGTMTLFGCGLLWASLILLVLSRWAPWAGWLIAPLFGAFLLMQLLRWVAQKPTP